MFVYLRTFVLGRNLFKVSSNHSSGDQVDPEKSAEIFSTDRGILVIENPVKKRILHFLSHGEKTGSEIREELDKAKSTISVHLKDLQELGLIKEQEHSQDKRKKVFLITGDFFGESQSPSDQHYKKILENLSNSAGDSYDFLKNMFHLIRYGFDSLGMNVRPALKEMGRDAGKNLAENFESGNLADLLIEIQEFWEENRLGEMDLEDNQMLVQDCFDCSGLPDIDKSVCSLDEGMIEGIISEKIGEEVSVSEKDCYGKGDDYCKFEIESE